MIEQKCITFEKRIFEESAIASTTKSKLSGELSKLHFLVTDTKNELTQNETKFIETSRIIDSLSRDVKSIDNDLREQLQKLSLNQTDRENELLKQLKSLEERLSKLQKC